MRYSDDLVEEIRMKNDIVDVISGYVKLTRRGSSYFGLCPFHNEKSPSFSVSPGKQMYYCFGCGAGGNVFTFLMEYENFTFVEALKFLADRAGVDLVRQNEGADPGAVLFDALAAAKARRSDVVLVDTAGRLHNKANLMKELAKLRKIIDRELPGAAKETLLVLDATTGQNGLIQARQFKETAGLTGIVLTKLDGTAKGGIVIAIAQELQVPVKFVGVGEGIDDLKPFDPTAFVRDMI